MNRALVLKKQALKRWHFVPFEDKKKLVEKLKGFQPGTAALEIGKEAPFYQNGCFTGRFQAHAQVVMISFETTTLSTDKRYLSLVDIPPLPEEFNQ